MRSVRFLIAAGFGIGIVAGALFVPQPPRTQAQRQPPGRVSQCTGAITGTLSVDTVRMCDPVDVTVKLEPECPICPNGINVVYVQIDKAFQADWMVQESLSSFEELRGNARRNSAYPFQIGVVHYNMNQVRTVLRMTDNLDSARGPLSQPVLGHDPFGDVIGAAQAALELMRDARRRLGDVPENDHPCEFVVFFASTKNIYVDQGRKMVEAARMITGDGIKLFVGCPEDVVDYCVDTKKMPRSEQYYTEAFDHGRLLRMVKDHMRNIADDAVTVRDLYLSQFLPLEMQYVDGSAKPPPARINRTQEARPRFRLDWEWKRIRSTDPQTVTYQARPLAEGTWEISGTMKLVDMQSMSRELVMPAQAVTVTGLCLPPPTPVPSDTPTEVPTPTYTATPTPTFTPTPTPTPTATPTATPTPKPLPIYLPIIIHERCKEQWVYSDIVLVMDMSTSMNRGTGGGRTKLEATLDAAKVFLTMMDLVPDGDGRSDRIAVVGFNAKAWIEQGLSNDAAALHRAIDNLPSGQGQLTRIDLGFEVGLEALRSALGEPNTTPVIVLLTDGLPNQVPLDPDDRTMETTVRKAAQRAKDAGAKVYTVAIGLPEDINGVLMTQCATVPANFFYTPDPEELAGIYTQIAYSFGCPAGRHDWGRPWP